MFPTRVDAGYRAVGHPDQRAATRLLMLNYLQRLILNYGFLTRSRTADSFTSFKTPVETSTTPCTVTAGFQKAVDCDVIIAKESNIVKGKF